MALGAFFGALGAMALDVQWATLDARGALLVG